MDDAGQPWATVRRGSEIWALHQGASMTFGRARDADIRIGHEPEDDYVSRVAGRLVALEDTVLVRNESRTQALLLQGAYGPDTVIKPQTAVATLASDYSRLIVPGRHGARYRISIAARGVRTGIAGADAPPVAAKQIGVTRSLTSEVTAREVRVLAALCEPLLTRSGSDAVPASYRQIAERLGGSASGMRKILDALRTRLSDLDGIPGLRSEEASATPDGGVNYLTALATWATHSGLVTAATVEKIDEADEADTGA